MSRVESRAACAGLDHGRNRRERSGAEKSKIRFKYSKIRSPTDGRNRASCGPNQTARATYALRRVCTPYNVMMLKQHAVNAYAVGTTS